MGDQKADFQDHLRLLITGLTNHLGRIPTEDEVMECIFGDKNNKTEKE